MLKNSSFVFLTFDLCAIIFLKIKFDNFVYLIIKLINSRFTHHKYFIFKRDHFLLLSETINYTCRYSLSKTIFRMMQQKQLIYIYIGKHLLYKSLE